MYEEHSNRVAATNSGKNSLIFPYVFSEMILTSPDILTTHTYFSIISLDRYGVLESLESIFGSSNFWFHNKKGLFQNEYIEEIDKQKGKKLGTIMLNWMHG